MMMLLFHYSLSLVSVSSGFFIRSRGANARQHLHVHGTSERPTWADTSLSLQANELQSRHHITFVSPLLEDGYPPAVNECRQRMMGNDNAIPSKPLLLYLPGFDGTILAPFIQFPSLGESFDVRGMRVGMDNRSTFDELKSVVLNYVLSAQCKEFEGIYLMGESFGGILAIQVARDIQSLPQFANVQLKGLILVNPATSYLRSALYKLGPPIANNDSALPPIGFIQYISSLMIQLVPLFLDEGQALQQLLLMLSSKALPVVLNTAEREAYLGRVAFDLVNRLKFMPLDTLKWRLEQWLERGCTLFEDQLEEMQNNSNSKLNGLESLKGLETLIVVGELDLTLPSVEEAKRLASKVFMNSRVHIVKGAGHASTCGGSLQLIQLLREFFSGLNAEHGHQSDPPINPIELFGLAARYDNASIGLSPLKYWTKEHYQKLSCELVNEQPSNPIFNEIK